MIEFQIEFDQKTKITVQDACIENGPLSNQNFIHKIFKKNVECASLILILLIRNKSSYKF